MDLSPGLPDAPISTEVRNNLFFAIKEALHNVRKHACASELLVRVRVETAEGDLVPNSIRLDFDQSPASTNQTAAEGVAVVSHPASTANGPRAMFYCIQIEDNGRGFAAEQAASTRNGLWNMRQRLEKIGGRFSLETGPGLGTKVRLVVPL